MFNIGTQELLIILFVVLLLFGAKRIPEVARSLGKGVADLRDAVSGVERELKGETGAPPRRREPESPRPGDASLLPGPSPAGPGEAGPRLEESPPRSDVPEPQIQGSGSATSRPPDRTEEAAGATRPQGPSPGAGLAG